MLCCLRTVLDLSGSVRPPFTVSVIMGRSKRRNRQKRQKPQGRGHYDLTVRRNELFEKFYSGLGIVPEGEWDSFVKTLQEPLPVTFRITGFKGRSKELLKIVKGQYLNDLMKSDGEGASVVPKNLTWYPHELGWQINLSRQEVRHNTRLEKLKKFLVFETESGNISRQEAVSMIPPLVMDIKPHHKVLDMCAAPGSKTSQLIEYLHTCDSPLGPDGFVIANDIDNKRCYLMVHQVKRLQSHCCAIINHDATILPKLRSGDGPRDFVEYDRVLCDVPCSGDGTMRKNFDIWNKWSMNQAINLHRQQLKILRRGLELLAVGGRLVYSTCSFHPIEDEAVVATMLDQCQGTVELVDVSSELPGLKYVEGLTSWKLYFGNVNDGKWYETYKSAKVDKVTNLNATFFCPSPDVAQTLHLDRCVRVLPHHQDTGGFFIAALTKTQPLPWQSPKPSAEIPIINDESQTESEKDDTDVGKSLQTDVSLQTTDGTNHQTQGSTGVASSPQQADATGNTDTEPRGDKRKAEDAQDRAFSGKHNKRMQGFKEDPFLFLKKDDPLFTPIREFYGVSDKLSAEQILYRTDTGRIRNFYFVSDALRNILQRNSSRVKFINTGVKVFGRSPSPLVPACDFRLNQEGLGALHPLLGRRILHFTRKDMLTLLSQENPYFERFTDDAREQFKKIDAGSVVFKYSPTSGTEPECDIVVCGWRGKTSVRVMVAKPERTHFVRMFGLELEDLVKEQTEDKERRKLAESVVSEVKGEDDMSSDPDDIAMEEEEDTEKNTECFNNVNKDDSNNGVVLSGSKEDIANTEGKDTLSTSEDIADTEGKVSDTLSTSEDIKNTEIEGKDTFH